MQKRKLSIELDIPKMSKYQNYLFNKLNFSKKLDYLESYKGKKVDLYLNKEEYFFNKNICSVLLEDMKYKYTRIFNLQDWSPRTYDVLNPNKFYFGIEIECIIPKTDHYNNISDLKKYIKQHNNIKYLNIKGDGSLRTKQELNDEHECQNCGYVFSLDSDSECPDCGSSQLDSDFGVEFVIMVPIDDFTGLKRLCDCLTNLNAYVNKSCGLHVHLDHRNLDQKQNAKKLDKCLEFFKTIVPKSRINNTYCKFEKSSFTSNCRYWAINKTSYKKHKTIEIRLHTSTTQFIKIYNWCQLLKQIIDCPLSKLDINDLGDLQDHLRMNGKGLEKLELNYWQKRIEKFKLNEKTEENNFQESPNLEIGA